MLDGPLTDIVPRELNRAFDETRDMLDLTYGPVLRNSPELDPDAVPLLNSLVAASAVLAAAPQVVKSPRALSQDLQRMLRQVASVVDPVEFPKDPYQALGSALDKLVGPPVSNYLAKELENITCFLIDCLQPEPMEPPSPEEWEFSMSRYQERLAGYQPVDPHPLINLQQRRLAWLREGAPVAWGGVELMGVLYPDGRFLAGWNNEVLDHLIEAVPGMPAELSDQTLDDGMKLAQKIAQKLCFEALLHQQRTPGVVFLGVRGLYPAHPNDPLEFYQPSGYDAEVLAMLGSLVSALNHPPAESEGFLESCVETLDEVPGELKRQADLYWFGTSAQKKLYGLADKLSRAPKTSPHELATFLEAIIQEWEESAPTQAGS